VVTLRDILTPAEFRTAALVAEGLSNGEIAKRLSLTTGFVKHRTSVIYEKIGAGKIERGSSREPRIVLALRFDREECRDYLPVGGHSERIHSHTQ